MSEVVPCLLHLYCLCRHWVQSAERQYQHECAIWSKPWVLWISRKKYHYLLLLQWWQVWLVLVTSACNGWKCLIFFSCYSTGLVSELVLRHNDNPIPNATVNSCVSLIRTLTINSTHEGRYECVTQLRNGTFRRYSAGYLHTIGEKIVYNTIWCE